MAINLHNVIKTSINILNPCQPIIVHKFKKITTDDYGISKNEYEKIEAEARIQAVNSFKLQHINGFNSSNVYKKVFLNGFQQGLNSSLDTNGDLIEINKRIWLIVEAPETWDYTGWNSLIISLQNDKE